MHGAIYKLDSDLWNFSMSAGVLFSLGTLAIVSVVFLFLRSSTLLVALCACVCY